MALALVVVAFGVYRLSARATAIAMSFAGRPEYAIFATAYFMTEMPLLLGAAALFLRHFARV
jgi:hypothetical protein